jgi:NAD-specific glutamate dehydrogenase
MSPKDNDKGNWTMLQRSEDAKMTLVRSLASRAAHTAGKTHKKSLRTFVEAFYANTSPEDILQVAPDDLLASALSVWDHIQKRTPKKPKVRVFNPTSLRKGWNCPHTVIEIVNDDMSFLVDSVTAALNRENLTVHIVIHPIVHVRRDRNGRLTGLYTAAAAAEGAAPESVMHVEINEQTLPEKLRGIQKTSRSPTSSRSWTRRVCRCRRASSRRPNRFSAGSRTTTSPSSAIANTASPPGARRRSSGSCRNRDSGCCVSPPPPYSKGCRIRRSCRPISPTSFAGRRS